MPKGESNLAQTLSVDFHSFLVPCYTANAVFYTLAGIFYIAQAYVVIPHTQALNQALKFEIRISPTNFHPTAESLNDSSKVTTTSKVLQAGKHLQADAKLRGANGYHFNLLHIK